MSSKEAVCKYQLLKSVSLLVQGIKPWPTAGRVEAGEHFMDKESGRGNFWQICVDAFYG